MNFLGVGQVDKLGADWGVLSDYITLENGVGDWGLPDLVPEAQCRPSVTQEHTLRPHDYSLLLSSQKKKAGNGKLFPREPPRVLSAIAISCLIGLPQLRAARAWTKRV